MDAYRPCLSYLDLRTGNWASKVMAWLDTTLQPTASELHYRILPAVLVFRLNEANNYKWVVQEAMGRLCHYLHLFER